MPVTAQNRYRKAKLRQAFTLIELLIVIAILGILAAAVLVAVNPAKRASQARDAQRKTNIAQIATALETYYTVHGFYPTIGGCWSCDAVNIEGALQNSGDLKKLPQDPNYNPGSEYDRYDYGEANSCWSVDAGGNGYAIWAWLEDASDKDVTHYPDNPSCPAQGILLTGTDPAGKLRGAYMFVSGKKVK